MWGINPEEVSSIKKRLNPRYFAQGTLFAAPELVTTNLLEVLNFKPEYIVLAVPSAFIVSTIKSFVDDLKIKCVFINVAKGLNPRTDNV
jgi:glycerol-3-phosphate dehydrogenase